MKRNRSKAAIGVLLVCSLSLFFQDFLSSDQINVPFARVVVDNDFPEDIQFAGDVKGLGDVNGDGFPDIVFGGNELAWYAYPSWDKTLIAKAEEQFSTDMQLGDVDRDGDLDVIVPDGGQGKLGWFENPGPSSDPAKASWKYHLIGYHHDWAHDVEIGDINGDGKLDVVTRKGFTIIWLQDDINSFNKIRISTSFSEGEGVALADINWDGRLDIVQNGYWLKGPEDSVNGNWEGHSIDDTWPTQVGVTVADINSDGRLDVLFSPAESAGRLSWYEAPTDPEDGKWLERIIDDDVEFVHTFKVADVNNDGQLDVVTAEMHQSSKRRVSVYVKDSLNWIRQVIATTGSHNIRIGDIARDGDIDIVGANWGGDHHPLEMWENKLIDRDKVSIQENWNYIEVDGERKKWGDYDDPPYLRYFGLDAGDVTRDNCQDLVSGRYVYLNPCRGEAGRWSRVDLGMNVDGMLILDVNGRVGVIAEALPNLYWLFPMNREATSWKAQPIGTIPPTEHINGQGYAKAQIIAGGAPEIVLTGGDGIYYFEVPGIPELGNWPRTKIADDSSEEGIGVGDLDRDDDIDIVASGKDGHMIYWWENQRDRGALWTKHAIGQTVEWADRFAVADMNGDGRLDVVVTEEVSYHGANIYWFEQPKGTSDRSWVRHKVATQYSTNAMDVADLDRDGDIDIVTGEHRGTRRLTMWENVNRGSSWVERLIDVGKENHLGARVVDLNGDGKLEIVGIAWDTYPYLHLWEQNAAL